MAENSSAADHEIVHLGKGDTFRIDRYVGLTSTIRIAVEFGNVQFYGIALARKVPENWGCGFRCRIYVGTNVVDGDPVKLVVPSDVAAGNSKPISEKKRDELAYENEPVVVDLHLGAADWVVYRGGLSVSLRAEGDEDAVIHRLLST